MYFNLEGGEGVTYFNSKERFIGIIKTARAIAYL